jgi:serine/threonine-protein kinase RsbW
VIVTDELKRSIEIRIPSELGYEKVAMEAAATVARQMGFSPDRVQDLKTAVSEACLNAIEHGNQLDVRTRVLVVLTVQPSGLEVNVADSGKELIPIRPPQAGREEDYRGWGMFLIRNLVDEVEVQSEPNVGNQVRMVIRLGEQ